MKCKHIQRQLLEYSEDLLDRKTQERIHAHLQQCPACRQELAHLKQTVHLLHRTPLTPSQEPSEAFWNDFTNTVMRKVKRMDAPAPRPVFSFFPQFRVAAAAFAVVLLVVGAGYLWYAMSLQQPSVPPSERLTQVSPVPSQDTPRAAQPPKRGLPEFEGIASEDLLYDILEQEFAFTEGKPERMYRADYSDEMLYFLISTLTEEEKDQLLTELYKLK